MITLEDLKKAAKQVHYGDAWKILVRLFVEEKRTEFVFKYIVDEISDSNDKIDLIMAIDSLVGIGLLKIEYRVRFPNGQFSVGYEEPTKIPDSLEDNEGNVIDLKKCELFSVVVANDH